MTDRDEDLPNMPDSSGSRILNNMTHVIGRAAGTARDLGISMTNAASALREATPKRKKQNSYAPPTPSKEMEQKKPKQ